MAEVTEGNDPTSYEYYDNGSRKSVVYPGGAREDYTYYDDGLLKTLVNKKAGGTVLDSYSYTYDAAHNQTSKTDSKGVTSYEYDSLNRLSKVTEPSGKTTSYLYDKAGNRIQETIIENSSGTTTSTTTTYEYNEQNRLTETVTRSGFVTEKVKYEYDNNGNTVIKVKETTKPVDPDMAGSFAFAKAGTTTTREVAFMEYNVWNQMVKTIDGDKTLTYRYNGEGYRVEKEVNGQVTRYMYEADKVILELDVQGNETAKNTYGTGIISRTADDQTAYYMYNGHGDVTALLSSTGDVLTTYYYDAFGNITEETGEADNPIRYAGYQYDEETGIYYLNARYYDPKIARFLTEDTYRGDPNDPLSLNLYTYCQNEPMMYSDPSGLRPAEGATSDEQSKIDVEKAKEKEKKDKERREKEKKEKEEHIKAIDKEIERIKKEAGDKKLTNKAKEIIERLEKLKELVERHKPTDDISSISESDSIESEDKYILNPESLVEYVVNSNLNETQMEALLKINDYSNNSDIQKNDGNPLIFFFEGAGSYNFQDANSNHPEGRFGAMAVVVKDGKIAGVFLNASTLPDNPSGYYQGKGIATVDPGVYSFNSGLHKNQTGNETHNDNKYPALHVNGNAAVPADRPNNPNSTASGIHVHKGYSKDNPTNPTSLGCLIVHTNDYGKFAEAVGFADKDNVAKGDPHISVSGIIVIDRSLVK